MVRKRSPENGNPTGGSVEKTWFIAASELTLLPRPTRSLLHTVDLRGMPRKHLLSILDEAEAWVHTIAALESGALRVYRFYALASKGRSGGKR